MENTILNPDDFLGYPRLWTPERNAQAWENLYEALTEKLRNRQAAMGMYIVCGVQGAGKTSWIRHNRAFFAASSIIIDAALPAARHRQRALAIAREFAVDAEAVWIDTPLAVALARNALRSPDEQVAEDAVRNVHAIFEVPSLAEGFIKVHRVASVSAG